MQRAESGRDDGGNVFFAGKPERSQLPERVRPKHVLPPGDGCGDGPRHGGLAALERAIEDSASAEGQVGFPEEFKSFSWDFLRRVKIQQAGGTGRGAFAADFRRGRLCGPSVYAG